MSKAFLIPAALFALAACGEAPETVQAESEPEAPDTIVLGDQGPGEGAPDGIEVAELEPLDPPAPGEPGGLPDDRTPLDESPFTPESAQGAAQVVELYWLAIEDGDFAKAYAMWGDGGAASGMSEEAFAASFDKYSEIHANVGAPGEIEGAAGSLYVEVPVQAYGRLAEDGSQFNLLGPITLRRVNDVPGATEDQLSWHISDSGLTPRP